MERIETFVSDEVAAKIRESARVNDRSVSAEVRRALQLYLQLLDKRAEAGEPQPA